MKLLLVSGRHRDAASALASDGALAADLVAQGCAVRWLCPVPRGYRPPAPKGVELHWVESPVPARGVVDGRLLDGPLEAAAAGLIRADMPDLCHHLAFGGAHSANLSWVAQRLGAPVLISLEPRSTLCHRGDLRHASGRVCASWLEPQRCWECSLGERGDGDLGAVERGMGWLFGGAALMPWPGPLAFENRLELLHGGLQAARRLLVRSAADARQLQSIGLRADQFEVLPEPSAAALLELYRRLIAS